MPKAGVSDQRRPSPKEAIELANKENLGKLKVFLGAAPGVGKTYAMLAAARAQLSDGVDVAVGVIETHGRAETAALLEGLEVLPRKTVGYRGRTLMEFDVEAAIARHPKLLLVDEFAHSNAPGTLHTKRYQDVEELLRAGIDVWTTLNVQHLESLTDVVERITGIVIRETVPDKILELADEIVVVDLPPDELIQRLKEGKVYLPENARRAADQFFRAGNLTALRELALRRTTDRVDEKMLQHLRKNSIPGAWPTAERLLVCVGSDENSEAVVRTASRMASALKSPLIAVQLMSPEAEDADRSTRRRSEKALRLAARLGADTTRLTGPDFVTEILRYARNHNITQIIIGRSGAGRVASLFGRSLSESLTAKAADIAVTVVAPLDDTAKASPWAWPKVDNWVRVAASSAAAVALAVGAGWSLSKLTPLPNVSMIFLLAVLGCAIRFGVASAIAASLLSFLAYNFFFIEPFFTFTVARPYELVSLFVFLLVAFVTASLAGRLRERSDVLQRRAAATQALYDFSRKLSGAAKLDDVLYLLPAHVAETVKGTAIILLKEGSELAIRGSWPPEDTLATPDWAAARWSFKEGKPAGRFTSTMPNARFNFRPLDAPEAHLGVIGFAPDDTSDTLPFSLDAEMQALTDQGAIALERTLLVDQAAKTAAVIESERLRGALLSSLSHDLRTPLSSIVGSVTSLRTLGDKLSKSDSADLLATIDEEAARLTRFVSNLLDMTRLEAGVIDIRGDWVDVADVARGAVTRARKTLDNPKITLKIGPALPLIAGDAALLEQVIFNLLDNARKYAGAASQTVVEIAKAGEEIRLTVTDDGPGVPAGALDLIFEKFYRVSAGDGRAAGTGLGLSICRAIVKAMGGSIAAESPAANGRGTRIVVRLPAGDPPTPSLAKRDAKP